MLSKNTLQMWLQKLKEPIYDSNLNKKCVDSKLANDISISFPERSIAFVKK